MKKLFLCTIVCCLFLISVCSALTIDLSDYDLPDFDSEDYPTAEIYSNYLVVGQVSGSQLFLTSIPFTADSSNLYSSTGQLITVFDLVSSEWSLSNFSNGEEGYDGQYTNYSSIITANYTVYDNEDNSVIIYQPIQEGGENMSQVLTDLTTVMTSVLTNATSLVTWITNNPLVYLWVIMAIIIAIIAFVRGFIRGV